MTLEQLQANWPILAGFVAGIGAWAKTSNTASKTEKRVDTIEKDITAIKESAARCAASVEGTQRAVELLLKKELGG